MKVTIQDDSGVTILEKQFWGTSIPEPAPEPALFAFTTTVEQDIDTLEAGGTYKPLIDVLRRIVREKWAFTFPPLPPLPPLLNPYPLTFPPYPTYPTFSPTTGGTAIQKDQNFQAYSGDGSGLQENV